MGAIVVVWRFFGDSVLPINACNTNYALFDVDALANPTNLRKDTSVSARVRILGEDMCCSESEEEQAMDFMDDISDETDENEEDEEKILKSEGTVVSDGVTTGVYPIRVEMDESFIAGAYDDGTLAFFSVADVELGKRPNKGRSPSSPSCYKSFMYGQQRESTWRLRD